MKKFIIIILLAGIVALLLSSCGGGGGRAGVVYRNHYGYGGWWGYPGYVDRRPIIVPPPDSGDKEAVNLPVYPDTGGPGLEAMPQPVEPMPEPMAEPMMDMDMGMPEMMDFGE